MPSSSKPLQALTLLADSAHLSNRPVPRAPDGLYGWETSSTQPDEYPDQNHSLLTNFIDEVQSVIQKGGIEVDAKTIEALLDTAFHPNSADDRKGALGKILTILARLPPSSAIVQKANDIVIAELYNTNPHPPSSFLGSFAYRQADGGNNNILNPDLGRAGIPYSRSVEGQRALYALPDSGLVFDSLLKRQGHVDHPAGTSSLTFAFATIVIHSLFRTDPRDWSINNTSSYLDLSPLYGTNQSMQDQVRDKAAGRGLLFPDTFSEDRLGFLPPAASALLVILSRNHNYIADRILKINERKLWSDPLPEDPALRAKQDEEVFQTAKLVNCGHFMSLILGDYVAGFLGASEGSNWNMKPFGLINSHGVEVTRGQGNHCSVEFNVLYRWHATIADEDEIWIEGLFDELFDQKPFDQLTLADFWTAASKMRADLTPHPKERTFAGLKRGADGRFSDEDLSDILQHATEKPAASFRAQGTPGVLRIVEILGIEQARRWGVCTMNEFRKFLHLKQFKDFEDWNPDPEIANTARRLYGHIDNLELYTGLQCEAIMPLDPGSRFSCGYTITRAILSDAISLIRGDRFFTTDFTPRNLTTWGFQDCQRNMENGALGAQLPTLLMRHLPRQYPYNSVYTCFPFSTPHKSQESLQKQGISNRYSFERPKSIGAPKVLETFTAIDFVFQHAEVFWGNYAVNDLTNCGFTSIIYRTLTNGPEKDLLAQALFPDMASVDSAVRWYSATISKKIQEKCWKFGNIQGTHLDIIRDVITATSIQWAAQTLGSVPLKTKENSSGLYTEQEVYAIFCDLYSLIYLSTGDEEHRFSLQTRIIESAKIIKVITTGMISRATSHATHKNSARSVLCEKNQMLEHVLIHAQPSKFINELAKSNLTVDELMSFAIGVVSSCSMIQVQAAAEVVAFYFNAERDDQRAHIAHLIQLNDEQSEELLRGYVLEALRLNPQCIDQLMEAVVNTSIPQGHNIHPLNINAGDAIRTSFKKAQLNDSDFPNPTVIDPRRQNSWYRRYGVGFPFNLGQYGQSYFERTIVELMKAIFRLKNVRCAVGDAGRLQELRGISHDDNEKTYYLRSTGSLSPFPDSLTLVFDE